MLQAFARPPAPYRELAKGHKMDCPQGTIRHLKGNSLG